MPTNHQNGEIEIELVFFLIRQGSNIYRTPIYGQNL